MTPADFRAARKQLGLNQAELADMLGLARNSVSKIERGEHTPSATVLRLMQAYADGYRPRDWEGAPPNISIEDWQAIRAKIFGGDPSVLYGRFNNKMQDTPSGA